VSEVLGQKTERRSVIYKFTVAERWHCNTRPESGTAILVNLTHAQALVLAGDLIRSVSAGVPADFVLHGEMSVSPTPAVPPVDL
jgi:hypothetical protein